MYKSQKKSAHGKEGRLKTGRVKAVDRALRDVAVVETTGIKGRSEREACFFRSRRRTRVHPLPGVAGASGGVASDGRASP